MKQTNKRPAKFKNIAKVIMIARYTKGLSQNELALEIGYRNGQFISNVERGLCSLPSEKVYATALALNIDHEVITSAMIADFTKNLMATVLVSEPPKIPEKISLASLH